MFIATLIASERLSAGDISEASDRLIRAGLRVERSHWIDEGIAADIAFNGDPLAARGALERSLAATDIVVQPAEGRRKQLLVADMDSTMITVECIDELADYAGIKPQIADVTERAMRGELDFADALDARVALLKGLDEGAIARCLEERVEIMPGAELLVRTMRGWGATTILVSGGFTRFAEPVADRIGFERVLANRLLIEDGVLTGKVEKPIVDSSTKQATLEAAIGHLDIDDHLSMAVGDGANDLAMIRRAGLGVAYHAKPIVAQAAGARIDHGDLSALLYAQGVPRSGWVAD
ncbi:phosphoserine phosphatase SerB [Sphingomonas japonica]|uniref:Phosphoserine phosphatase n=1 Tax=Sphingomonas japonica TaxID=511662 RepID=A0ABX0U1F9_9SPHN|nr:phosphoserine phosphatase SerB [Sphingomonas japonica]NIJ24328.1 phosphoserine phosphatase [Sphingomonas japonica]